MSNEIEELRAEVADWKRRYSELNRAYSVLTLKCVMEREKSLRGSFIGSIQAKEMPQAVRGSETIVGQNPV